MTTQTTPNYQCFLSPKLKIITMATEPGRQKIVRWVEELVRDIDTNEEIKGPLMQSVGDCRQAKPVEFSDDDNGKPGKVVMKAWVSWNSAYNRWDVFAEWVDDFYWENKFQTTNPELN